MYVSVIKVKKPITNILKYLGLKGKNPITNIIKILRTIPAHTGH